MSRTPAPSLTKQPFAQQAEAVCGYDMMRALRAGIGARIAYPYRVTAWTLVDILATADGVSLAIRFDGDVRDRHVTIERRAKK